MAEHGVRRRSRRLSRRPHARLFAERHRRRAARTIACRLLRTTRSLKVGPALLGRVIDAHGRCIDGRSQPVLPFRVRLDRQPPPATERPRIRTPLATGVHAIDTLLTCGRGQRLGIFSGSGVGKSVLLGMMSRYTDADVIVTGLVGERGREVNEFLERDLGADGACSAAWSSSPRAMSRRSTAFMPRRRQRRSPNIFAIKANTCCC